AHAGRRRAVAPRRPRGGGRGAVAAPKAGAAHGPAGAAVAGGGARVTPGSSPPPYAGVATRGVAIVVDVVIIDVLTVVGVAIASLVLRTIVPGHHSLGVPEVVTAGAIWLI